MQRALGPDAISGDALRRDVGARGRSERRERIPGLCQRRLRQHGLERLLPQRAHVGKAHPVRRQHAGQRMQQHARHAERVGDEARVLAARAAEAAQRVLGDVVAALHRDVLDRIRHVRDGDLEESVRDFLGRVRAAGPRGDVGGERRELLAHDRGVERLVARRAEHARKELRIELADHHVAIGDRQRAAAPVRGGAGIGARGFGADAKARAIETADRSAAGRHGVDAHHRRAQPHAGDLGDEGALVLAGVVRDVRRRAAHVEADDPVEAREPRNFDGTDDAAGGSRQDRVLALEPMRIGQAAARLHELQPWRAFRFLRAGARRFLRIARRVR